MPDVFSEAEETAGLDIAEEIEQSPGGEYEITAPEGTTPDAPTEAAEQPEGRQRNPNGTFAPRQQTAPQRTPNHDPNRTVPIHVIQEERQKRQALEQRLNERDREWAVIQERVRIFQGQQEQEAQRRQQMERAQVQAQRDPEPDPEGDPIAHNQWMIRRQAERIQWLEHQTQATQQQAQQNYQQTVAQQTISQIGQQVQNMQTQFAMQTPDYPEAFAHLAQTRYSELQLMGYSEQQIPQILEQERTMIITGCINRDPNSGQITWRDNPARVAYELAKSRGYAGQQPQMQVPTAQPSIPMQVSPNAQRVQQQQLRVDQTQPLGGRSPNSDMPLSMESLAKMSEREFSELMNSNPDLVDQMMGGR